MNKLEHALDAASRGLPVFPADGKRPCIRRWPDNATLKKSVIRRWWSRWPDADIGIALPSDIYVLDADTPMAVDALLEIECDTLVVCTARGIHAYFHVPHELARKTPPPAAQGFDAVEGKGRPGPVTWAGSVHHSGHEYYIACDAPIANMPDELVRAIGPKVYSSRSGGEATLEERTRWNARRRIGTEAAADASSDLRVTIRALRAELPEMETGWADRFYRAAAYMGPHVSAGAMCFEHVCAQFVAAFDELNEQNGDGEHVERSIRRGIAVGARSAEL